jgi:hypothetical protein
VPSHFKSCTHLLKLVRATSKVWTSQLLISLPAVFELFIDELLLLLLPLLLLAEKESAPASFACLQLCSP